MNASSRNVERFTKSIRGSNYDNLDILPANMSFRNFDVFLARMRNSRSRLKKALKAVKKDYDVILLDCPPNISTLSESVFKASDVILVPVIPTTLSQRTFEQLVDFFRVNKIPLKKLSAFFSMVQTVKSLHADLMDELSGQYKKQFYFSAYPLCFGHRTDGRASCSGSGEALRKARLPRPIRLFIAM